MTRDELMFARLRNAEADLREAEAVYAYWSAQAQAAGLVTSTSLAGDDLKVLRAEVASLRKATARND